MTKFSTLKQTSSDLKKEKLLHLIDDKKTSLVKAAKLLGIPYADAK